MVLFVFYGECYFIKLCLKFIKWCIYFIKCLLYFSKSEMSFIKGWLVIYRMWCVRLLRCCTYFVPCFVFPQVIFCVLSALFFFSKMPKWCIAFCRVELMEPNFIYLAVWERIWRGYLLVDPYIRGFLEPSCERGHRSSPMVDVNKRKINGVKQTQTLTMVRCDVHGLNVKAESDVAVH